MISKTNFEYKFTRRTSLFSSTVRLDLLVKISIEYIPIKGSHRGIKLKIRTVKQLSTLENKNFGNISPSLGYMWLRPVGITVLPGRYLLTGSKRIPVARFDTHGLKPQYYHRLIGFINLIRIQVQILYNH